MTFEAILTSIGMSFEDLVVLMAGLTAAASSVHPSSVATTASRGRSPAISSTRARPSPSGAKGTSSAPPSSPPARAGASSVHV